MNLPSTLLKAGADPNAQYDDGYTTLIAAAGSNKNSDVVTSTAITAYIDINHGVSGLLLIEKESILQAGAEEA